MTVPAERSVSSGDPETAHRPLLGRRVGGDVVLVGGLYLLSMVVYAVLAHANSVPVIFPDEFIYGNVAQSIAAGDGVSWRGEPQSLRSLLYVISIAPSWLIDSGNSAYVIAKVLNAAMASLVVFPTWLLARSLIGARAALVPAVLTLAGTWMVSTGHILTENLALPLAVASMAGMVAALRQPGSRWGVVALAFAVAATFARLQLVVLVPIFVLALIADCVRQRTEMRARLAAHRPLLLATAGLAGLGLLAVLVSGSLLGIYEPVRHYSPSLGRVLGATGQHALGLVVAVGVLPAVGTLALALTPACWRDDMSGPLLCVTLCAFVVFVLQAGWFGAGFDLKWDIERYVTYVAPLALVAMMLVPGRVSLLTAMTATGAVGLCLLATDEVRAFVEQRAVSSATTRLGQLGGPFADHPALALAVAGTIVGVGGMVMLARAAAPAGGHVWLLATAGALLAILVVESQVAWKKEIDEADYRRSSQPANLEWVDRVTSGEVGIFNPVIENPTLFQTELFNEHVRGRYNAFGPSSAGPTCQVSVAEDGTLGSDACTPPKQLLVESSLVRSTFYGERRLAENLPNSRLIESTQSPPRLRSAVTLPCALPGTPFEGVRGGVRRCSGALTTQLWLGASANLLIRFRGGAVQHYGKIGETVYDFRPSAIKDIRVPVEAGASTTTLQLDWDSTENAPTLLSVKLEQGRQVTGLL